MERFRRRENEQISVFSLPLSTEKGKYESLLEN